MSFEKLERAMTFQDQYESRVEEAARHIRKRIGREYRPDFGIVLGSGLGDLAEALEHPTTIDYESIPHFPRTTVEGHEGKLLVGSLEGVPVIGLKGRKHFYEVADEPLNNGILQCVFPVHVLANLGVRNYLATNAAGGLNPAFRVGDAMILRSHINLLPNPLLGRHMNFLRVDGMRTWRFQPMNGAYDSDLRGILREAGRQLTGIHEGVYLAVTGPTYETEGESVAFRDGLGADAVGMSTTPEVIVARNRGMNAVGISCITNVIASDGTNATNHEEVKAVLESREVKDRFSFLIKDFFRIYKNREREKR